MSLPLKTPPNSICLLRLSAIGDVTHVVPIVRQMQQHWPDTSITWIIGKTEHALVEDLDRITFVVFDKTKRSGAYQDLRRQLQNKPFDLLLHMQVSLRAGLASKLVKAPVRIGFDRARSRNFHRLFINDRIGGNPRAHVLDGFFEFTRHLGLHPETPRWDIPIPKRARTAIDTLIEPGTKILVVNPCSSNRTANWRNWAAEKYAQVAEYACDRYGLICVLSGGPADEERTFAQNIVDCSKSPIMNLVGQTNLKELLALLNRATLVISPDTGPAHMANAVGTPVIGLYATSNPERTGPYNLRELTVNRYPDALLKFYGKQVAEVPWGKRVRDPAAMDLILVTDVTQKIDLAMKNLPERRNP